MSVLKVKRNGVWEVVSGLAGGASNGATVYVQDDEPANASVGTLWLDTDEEGTGGSGSVNLPENVVTCDLEGATEDESTVPVNADTLGGFAASEFYRTSTLLAEDITSQIVLDAIVKDMYMSCFRLGNLVVLTVAFNLNSSPNPYAFTPIMHGLPVSIGATNCGALVSSEASHSAVLESYDGILYVRSGQTALGTSNFWRGQLIYVCNTEVTT